MCGIAGIFAYTPSAPPVDQCEITRIIDHMSTRGPDGSGLSISEDHRLALAHRRLSIIDPDARSNQPMWSQDSRLAITFNGEIYNYRELRAELAGKGHAFRTTSDTEVLLHAYAEYGHRMVERLRGMFAFAVWDSEVLGLFLARDPYGIKPLYYADTQGVFRFASQVRGLVAGGAIASEPDLAGWVGFHLFGSVPEPFTTHTAVRCLPAGSTLEVHGAGVSEPRPYFNIAATYEASPVAASTIVADNKARFREAVIDSVKHHLVADVPVGCFLSAGTDSSAILALASHMTSGKFQAVTIAFEEFAGGPNDEVPLAAVTARACGADHVVRRVCADEFDADYDSILGAMDQPTIDGVNTWFVSKAAHEIGLKVALSGLGGDELLGGYPSFRDIPRWVARCAPFAHIPGLGKASRLGISRLQGWVEIGNPKLAGMIEYGGTYAGSYLLRRSVRMPWELGALMEPEMLRAGLERLRPFDLVQRALRPEPPDGFAKVAALESALYMRNQLLRDADWASMAHSIEVRVPLVDHVLLQSLAGLGVRPSKRWLVEASIEPPLDTIMNRAKTGFSTPIGAWIERRRNGVDGTTPLSPSKVSRRWAIDVARSWSRSLGQDTGLR